MFSRSSDLHAHAGFARFQESAQLVEVVGARHGGVRGSRPRIDCETGNPQLAGDILVRQFEFIKGIRQFGSKLESASSPHAVVSPNSTFLHRTSFLTVALHRGHYT